MATCIICGRDAGFLSEVCSSCKEKRSPGSGGKPLEKRHVSSPALLREAVFEIYRNRAVLSIAAILPILCSLALRMACSGYVCTSDNESTTSIYYLFYFARLPFYVMFATICHRIVLLGDTSLQNRWGLFWSIRETRFVGWILVLGIITTAVSLPITLLIWRLPFDVLTWMFEWSPFSISFYSCVLASTYIDGRFGLVLPATAVGNKIYPLESWRYTAGSGWSIFVALMIPILIAKFMDYLLFDLLLNTDSLIANTLASLLYYPVIGIGVVVITIAYRELMLSPIGDATD